MNAPVRTRQTPVREAEPTATPANPPIRRRVRVANSDRYYVDPAIIPEGWVYQWKRFSVLGQEEPAYMAELGQLGFTPVPAERHDGVFIPSGSKGAIIIGGQILMERSILDEEDARMEEKQRADAQVRGSREQFGMAPKASGFEVNDPAKRYGQRMNVGHERVDAPKPKYLPSVDD